MYLIVYLKKITQTKSKCSLKTKTKLSECEVNEKMKRF